MNAFLVAYHHEQNLSITVLFSLDSESSHLVLVGYSSTKSLTAVSTVQNDKLVQINLLAPFYSYCMKATEDAVHVLQNTVKII